MITLTKTEVNAGTLQRDCTRQRMKLAIALFDVENAHAQLAELEPEGRQYKNGLKQLKATLEVYWRIDEQVESFLQRSRAN